MNWLVVAGVCIVVGVATWGVVSILDGDGGFDCDGGFSNADWRLDKTKAGRAIAECDWFDGKPKAEVIRTLGKADESNRGWYMWEIGDSSAGIGPSAWFLLLRARNGIVVNSRAKIYPT